ncbi:hypothetical protein, partial [uncultured Flavobacterium sp.]|uniref:hypothetical protein n=1 Tax=uncultured Flavobacterium sp. TaxID=165435 RepID=UPI0030CA4B13
MKKFYVFLLLVGSLGFSQTNGITYQAVIMNPSGQSIPGVNNINAPLANKAICLKFAIIDYNSQTEYLETIQTTTDAFGMVNLIIGTGTKIGGYAATFTDILWNNNAKNLKVDISTTGVCSYYNEISNQPFTYVPFAMFALNTENTEAIATIESLLIDLQIELDDFQLGVGVGPDGLYVANPNTNYINMSTSVIDATENLDAAVAAVQADVDANETASNTSDAALQTNIDALSSTVVSNNTAATNAIALKEDAANKSTDVTLSD